MGDSGGNTQFLQLILMPYQSITTSDQCIQYTSESVNIKDKYTFRERIKHYLLNEYPKLGSIVTNTTNTIQYIGLTLNSGKILVHDCNCYQNECIEDSIVQQGFLGGLFDAECSACDKQTLGEKTLKMRSKIKNVNKLGPKILDKSLFSHNYNTYSTFFFRFDTILAHT